MTTRRLQQAAETGDLSVQRVAGRTLLIDSAVLAAYLRTSRSGRRWGHRTARAALELLNDGRTTLLSGSELSRLRSRLSVLSGAGIAHKLNAAAGWFRYRSVGEASAETLAGVRLTGPSALTDERLAEQLSLLPGPASSVFGVVDDLSMAEVELALVPDGEGDIFLAERASAGGPPRSWWTSFYSVTRGSRRQRNWSSSAGAPHVDVGAGARAAADRAREGHRP